MAGTMNAATGRRSSTMASHRPGSKRGRYHPLRPPRHRSVDEQGATGGRERRGGHESEPVPVPAGGAVRGDPWRTTTALGEPVVPEVYMMSMTSAGPVAAGPPAGSESSGSNSDSQPGGPIAVVGGGHQPDAAHVRRQLGPRGAATGGGTGQDGGGVGVGEDRPELRSGQPGIEGNGDGTGAVHGGVGGEPRERLVGADADDHPVPAVKAAVGEPAGQAVGVGVPVAEGQVASRRPGCARPRRRGGRPPWRRSHRVRSVRLTPFEDATGVVDHHGGDVLLADPRARASRGRTSSGMWVHRHSFHAEDIEGGNQSTWHMASWESTIRSA